MKKKIVRRDISFFLLGFFVCFLIFLIWDWDDNVKSFKQGWSDASRDNIEVTK